VAGADQTVEEVAEMNPVTAACDEEFMDSTIHNRRWGNFWRKGESVKNTDLTLFTRLEIGE
jgi:hypothetical protein